MTTTSILKYTNDWRAAHGITDAGPLTHQQTVEFARGLQDEVKQFSVRPERDGPPGPGQFAEWDADARAIPYSGTVDGVPAWKMASAMSENGEGRMFYISDTPAGRLLNDKEVQLAVADAVGGDNEKVGRDMTSQIFNGTWDANNVRSKYAIDDVIAVNDIVSEKMMATMAKGDVRTITATAEEDKVFVQTELPVLLANKEVTAINGIPKEQLLEIYKETGSYLEVNKVVAEASRELIDGTRYTLDSDTLSAGDRTVKLTGVDAPGLFEGTGVAGPVFDPGSAKVHVIDAPAAAPAVAPVNGAVAVLTIDDMDGAAFRDLGRNAELSNVLADAAHKLQAGEKPPFPLEDTNGNDVGRFEIMAAAPQSEPEPGTARLQFDLSQPAFEHDRDGQLSQSIMAAADQVGAQHTSDPIVFAAPDGQAIGTLNVTPAPAAPAPAPAPAKEYSSLSM